ncbi:unnamed protein product [marine sediment metagenome]|uniref:Uncharacterized protein n=1 Tax=marine sediment metagenome TaxID=412755 RepID=X1Q2F3_9ZZZZ
MPDQRELIRNSEERRFAAQQALTSIKDTLLTFKPINLVSASEVGPDKAIQPAEYSAFFRDWFNWTKDTMQEAKPLLTNMVKDTMQLYAHLEGTPKGKQAIPGA